MLSHSPVQAAIPCQFHTAKLGRGLSRSSHLTPSRLSQGRLLWTVSSGVLMISKDPPGNVCHAPHSKKGISCGLSHISVPTASYLPWAPRTEQRGLCLSLCPTRSFSFLCQGKVPAFLLSAFRAVTRSKASNPLLGALPAGHKQAWQSGGSPGPARGLCRSWTRFPGAVSEEFHAAS